MTLWLCCWLYGLNKICGVDECDIMIHWLYGHFHDIVSICMCRPKYIWLYAFCGCGCVGASFERVRVKKKRDLNTRKNKPGPRPCSHASRRQLPAHTPWLELTLIIHFCTHGWAHRYHVILPFSQNVRHTLLFMIFGVQFWLWFFLSIEVLYTMSIGQ